MCFPEKEDESIFVYDLEFMFTLEVWKFINKH